MARKFHIQPFDEGTLVKLELLKLYIRSWLHVFISAKEVFWKDIYIYDFFSGAGTDSKGKPGSPLIILNELRGHCPAIIEKGLKVRLLFNEPKSDVLDNLKKKVSDFFVECRAKSEFQCCDKCSTDDNCPFIVKIEQNEFKPLFLEIYPYMERKPSLPRFMFLDQFGIKEITENIFKKLTSLNRTDFLFFISSSFVRRFSELEEFSQYLKVEKEDFDESRPGHCHRIILEYYKKMVKNPDYYLAPFSIRKVANIYGLIFGSNNPRGMEKFLDAAWAIDKNTGEANFNIDNDKIIDGQLSIFPDENKIKKVDLFERNLLQWLTEEERTNEEIYFFTLSSGMRKTHAMDILRKNVSSLKITTTDKIRKGYFYLGYKPDKHLKIKKNE